MLLTSATSYSFNVNVSVINIVAVGTASSQPTPCDPELMHKHGGFIRPVPANDEAGGPTEADDGDNDNDGGVFDEEEEEGIAENSPVGQHLATAGNACFAG